MLCMGKISPQLADNEAWVDQTFEKCDDILHRQVYLGQGRQEGLLVYVEVAGQQSDAGGACVGCRMYSR